MEKTVSNKVILMRHGYYGSDGALNQQGVGQAQDIACQLIEAGLTPDIILHSPIKRALETAEVVTEIFKMAGKEVDMRQEDSLANKGIPHALSKLKNSHTVLAVSHQPDILAAVRELVGQYVSPGYGNAVVIESDCELNEMAKSNVSRLVNKLTPHIHQP